MSRPCSLLHRDDVRYFAAAICSMKKRDDGRPVRAQTLLGFLVSGEVLNNVVNRQDQTSNMKQGTPNEQVSELLLQSLEHEKGGVQDGPIPRQGHGDGAAGRGQPAAAQLVACECVVLAETKDHLNWEWIGKCGEKLLTGKEGKALKDAYEEIEDQEDEHLYHTKGWCRELWIQSLGMKAVRGSHVRAGNGSARV